MLAKIDCFSQYYQSDRFRLELKLPKRPGFHHFRFQSFQENRFIRIKDVVNCKEVLGNAILKNTPKNVFFTPVKWLDPVNVRRRTDDRVNDYMLSSPLYFDIDSDLSQGETWESAIEIAKRLILFLDDEQGRKPDWIVFSGRRGFHIYYWDWDEIPKESTSAESRIAAFRKSRIAIVEKLKKNGLIVDRLVTADPWRVLRVPGTLHGTTGLIAKVFANLEDFSIGKTKP